MSGSEYFNSDNDDEQEIEEEIILIEGDFINSDSDNDSEISYNSHLSWNHSDRRREHDRIRENVERIYNLDVEFLDKEKENNRYYLGLCAINSRNKRILLNIAIQPKTFMMFDIKSVLNYLAEYSIFHIHRNLFDISNIHLDIMKMDITPKSCWQTVILKTFWIRIIQRIWKRVFRERQDVLLKRRTLQNIRYFELHGRHLPTLHVLPTLHGMIKVMN